MNPLKSVPVVSSNRSFLRWLSLFLFLIFPGLLHSAVGTWTYVNPLPTSADYKGVAYGSGRFVALSGLGQVVTSTDGINWTRVALPVTDFLGDDIEFAAGLFVIVGAKDSFSKGAILTSADGLTWTEVVVNQVGGPAFTQAARYLGVAYGNGRFVAVSPTNLVVASSTDGVTWTKLTPPVISGVSFTEGITFGNGVFVLQSQNRQVIVWSDVTNTATATLQVIPLLSGLEGVFALDFGAGKFVAFTNSSTNKIITSTDGLTWTAATAPTTFFSGVGVKYVNDRFLAPGTSDSEGTKILTSSDGSSWSLINTPFRLSTTVAGFAYGGGVYVIAGESGQIMSSPDMTTFTVRAPAGPSFSEPTAAATNGSITVAVGGGYNASSGAIMSSTDGTTWTDRTPTGALYLTGVAYGNGKFVAVGGSAVGRSAKVHTSTDGITWSSGVNISTNPSTNPDLPNGLVFGNGLFVLVAAGGAIWTSPDGVTWTSRTSGISSSLKSLAFNGSKFITANDTSLSTATTQIAQSTDGITWSSLSSSGFDRFLLGIKGGNGIFLSRDRLGLVRSADGAVWSRVTLPTTISPTFGFNPSFVGGRFVTSGTINSTNFILDSVDGVSWEQAAPPRESYTVFESLGSTILSIGRNGAVSTTTFVSTPTTTVTPTATPTPTPTPSITPTPTPTGSPTATPTITPTPTSTPTPTPTVTTAPTPTPDPTPTFPAVGNYNGPGRAGNVSSRAQVQTGDNVLIGGLIIQGSTTKRVAFRGMGPNLAKFGLSASEVMADPVLEIFDAAGNKIAENDSWRSTQEALIISSGMAPSDDREAVCILDLPQGNYTAIVRGKNNTGGVGLVEIYELDANGNDGTKLVNISTRSFVGTSNQALIGGFIIIGTTAKKVIVRAIGPDLANFGIPAASVLPDTTLELRDGAGNLIGSNDDWRSNQEAEIIATTIAPRDNRESAYVATLPPGFYTVIVRGKNNSQGIGIVEMFTLP